MRCRWEAGRKPWFVFVLPPSDCRTSSRMAVWHLRARNSYASCCWLRWASGICDVQGTSSRCSNRGQPSGNLWRASRATTRPALDRHRSYGFPRSCDDDVSLPPRPATNRDFHLAGACLQELFGGCIELLFMPRHAEIIGVTFVDGVVCGLWVNIHPADWTVRAVVRFRTDFGVDGV